MGMQPEMWQSTGAASLLKAGDTACVKVWEKFCLWTWPIAGTGSGSPERAHVEKMDARCSAGRA